MPVAIGRPRVAEAGAAFIDTDDHEYAVYVGRITGRPGGGWLGAFERALLELDGTREVRVGPDSYGFVCLDERARAVLEGLRQARARADEAAPGDATRASGHGGPGEPPPREATAEATGPARLIIKYRSLVDEAFPSGGETI